jgi:hypothetical protein
MPCSFVQYRVVAYQSYRQLIAGGKEGQTGGHHQLVHGVQLKARGGSEAMDTMERQASSTASTSPLEEII